MLTLARLDQRDLDLDRYPVVALAYLEERGIDTREVRLAAPDIVGNLVDYVYGPEQRVFYDDRFDMFPDDVTEAHAGPACRQTRRCRSDLDELRHRPGHASQRRSPTAQVLAAPMPGGRSTSMTQWVLLCRRDADLGGTPARC